VPDRFTATATDQADKQPRGTPKSRSWQQAAHLFVLTAFAVAQPVYDRVGDRPAYLADMGVSAAAIVLLALTFSFLLPSLLAAIVWGVGRFSTRIGESLYAVIVCLLCTVTAAPLINRVDWLAAWISIGLTISVGTAATWVYLRFRPARLVVTVASPAIVVFPALFLLASPVAWQFFYPHQQISTERWNPVPVVVVVLDEFCGMTLVNENREIDAIRFPNFAKLAAGATWFRNATTVYPDTVHALPAILSGRYPSNNWTPGIADRPQNLFSVLQATDAYDIVAFEPISRLASLPVTNGESSHPSVLRQLTSIMPALSRVLLFHVTPLDLRSQLPEVPKLWFGFHEKTNADRRQRQGVFRYAKGDDRQEQFDHFLECLDDTPRPQLYFFHVLLPHIPWCYLPSGRKYIAETSSWELNDDIVLGDELYVEQCQQRQLLQLRFCDSQMGRLLERLHDTGLYDKCLLIVTADHGVSFKPGNLRRYANEGNLPDIMSVPLFIKAPGQSAAAVSDKNVETIDILPTITKFLGIDLHLQVDGVSVFDVTRPERPDKKFKREEMLSSSPMVVPPDILSHSTVSAEIRQRFGSPDAPDGLFRIGSHPELLGRAATDFPLGKGASTELKLTRGGSVYSHDPQELVPCYFEGKVVIPSNLTEPMDLAIAINGIVRATTRTYRVRGYRDQFSAMVPESAFHEGANDVRFYVVTVAAPTPNLIECAVQFSLR
jgi:hypothetical protein